MGTPLELSENRKLKVVIVEDEPLFRELLRGALEHEGDVEIIAAFEDAETAGERVPELAPDVVILDIELKGEMSGIELGIELRRTLPNLGIVLLSHHRVRNIYGLIPPGQEGGWSYLLKDTVQNVDMLRRTLHGAADGMLVLDPELVLNARAEPESDLARLTPRQLQTLQLMAKGYTNEAIARHLSVSVKSVENHANQVYRELGIDRSDRSVQPRVQAVVKYIMQTRLQ